MKPLRVALPLGIGDCHWVVTKLRALSAHHGGRPIHAYVNTSPDHASVGFLRICPQVAKAIESEDAIYHVYEDLPEPYKSERWSSLAGSANWSKNGTVFDYVLIANGHLERGEPLATWLPELDTEYRYSFRIPKVARDRARELVPPRSVLLYLSGTNANRGFHANIWRGEDWADVVRRLNAIGIRPVLVGANSQDDIAYRAMIVRHIRRLDYLDIIGQTSIPEIVAIIEGAAAWCGLNSGLGIVSAMRCTPTVMLWADHRFPIRGASTYTMHANMQRSWLSDDQMKTYRTISYNSPQMKPAYVVRTICEVMRRARSRRAA